MIQLSVLEVTFLAFLYQALVFDRSVVHVAFIDGAVLIIASMTIIETYVSLTSYFFSLRIEIKIKVLFIMVW